MTSTADERRDDNTTGDATNQADGRRRYRKPTISDYFQEGVVLGSGTSQPGACGP